MSRATIYKAEGGAGVAPKTGRALASALGVGPEALVGDPLLPKGDAPEPPEGKSGEERRGAQLGDRREESLAVFREQRDAVESYCQRWETRLAQENLTREATEEFFAASRSVFSGLQMGAGAEKIFADAGAWSGSIILSAARRYVRIFEALTDAKPQEQDAATTEQRRKQIREMTQQINSPPTRISA